MAVKFELLQIDKIDKICANCKNFDEDIETGRMYGPCKIAVSRLGSSAKAIKSAYQLCNEE